MFHITNMLNNKQNKTLHSLPCKQFSKICVVLVRVVLWKQKPEDKVAKSGLKKSTFIWIITHVALLQMTNVCLFVPQFTVECEWQRQASQTLSVPVTHVLSFGKLPSCWLVVLSTILIIKYLYWVFFFFFKKSLSNIIRMNIF